MTNDTRDSKIRAEIDRRLTLFAKQTAELAALTAEYETLPGKRPKINLNMVYDPETATLRGEGPTLHDGEGESLGIDRPDADLRHDAIKLHALCQGLELVFDEIACEPTPAKNAAVALICEIVERAERLASDIDRAESARKRVM
ncbi:MAG: hypothetical protein IOD05_07975 [Rhodobacter sp.]|nr:hypothetical protein [Rhodobacter sp.]MCA3493660.1 hypothetical protein [Rhodobacter sp.]MCA3500163.1 hypothetical protein [Rhodobacter sp.]MCA3503171.1 hypothetical protein [Rhodobacter sp.]MCA3517400.1 hypothetical protein [Rhodobacter sp.]